MKKYLTAFSFLSIFSLNSCLITRHNSERLGQFNVIQSSRPLVYEATLKSYPTSWNLFLIADDLPSTSESISPDSSIDVFIENIGNLPLEATTSKSLLSKKGLSESVKLNLNPGEKVRLFSGNLNDLIRYSSNIGLIGPDPHAPGKEIKARYYFLSNKNVASPRGNITVKLVNSDSI